MKNATTYIIIAIVVIILLFVLYMWYENKQTLATAIALTNANPTAAAALLNVNQENTAIPATISQSDATDVALTTLQAAGLL